MKSWKNRNYYHLIEDLSKASDLERLKSILRDIYDEFDVIYTTTNPNGSISARRGKQAIYYDGADYFFSINVDGSNTWKSIQLS